MRDAKIGIWENCLFKKESILILIWQYTLRFHLDRRVKPIKTKEKGEKTDHVLFLPNGKTEQYKDANGSWIKISLSKSQMEFFFFLELNSMILKFIWKMSRNSQLKKKNRIIVGDLFYQIIKCYISYMNMLYFKICECIKI